MGIEGVLIHNAQWDLDLLSIEVCGEVVLHEVISL